MERTSYYRAQGSHELAERFVNAAITALRAAERLPASGSPRVGDLCDIPGLRSWRVRGFPVRWFYFVTEDRLDVVRLLADAQDLGAALDDETD
jgi:toxin ParE1/3/4